MAIDYSNGDYVLYGREPEKPVVGWAKSGKVTAKNGTWAYDLKGVVIYGTGGDVAGSIEAGIATRKKTGQFLFIILPDA